MKLTRTEIQLVIDALEIVSPDNSEIGELANSLAVRFRQLWTRSQLPVTPTQRIALKKRAPKRPKRGVLRHSADL